MFAVASSIIVFFFLLLYGTDVGGVRVPIAAVMAGTRGIHIFTFFLPFLFFFFFFNGNIASFFPSTASTVSVSCEAGREDGRLSREEGRFPDGGRPSRDDGRDDGRFPPDDGRPSRDGCRLPPDGGRSRDDGRLPPDGGRSRDEGLDGMNQEYSATRTSLHVYPTYAQLPPG